MTNHTPEVPEDAVETTDEQLVVADVVASDEVVDGPSSAPPIVDASVAEAPSPPPAEAAAGSSPDSASLPDEGVEEVEVVDAEVEIEPGDSDDHEAQPEVDSEVVEAEVVDLDLGDEVAPAPIGTDFDVAASPTAPEAAPVAGFEGVMPEPPIPASPPAEPTQPAAPPASPVAPPAHTPPVSAAPTGGSFLDLPPLPDLPYQAPTPPSASPYPPPAPSYPQAADYPQAPASQAAYAPYSTDYSAQAAGQAYGHGTPVPAPQVQPAPVSPYGTPTGFAVQPYQEVAYGDTTMASLAHWGGLVATMLTGSSLGFLVPLIIMLTKGQTDPFVRAHAVESLNFNLTVLIGMIVSAVLVLAFVGIVGLIVIPIVAIILQILGAVAAGRGEPYRYPISIRFVK